MNKIMSMDDANNILCTIESKPTNAIEELMTVLNTEHTRFITAKSKILNYSCDDNRCCYILHRGSIALHRRGDGIVMFSESAPFVFGLTNQLNITDTMYLRTLEECEISIIDLTEANHLITQANLWKTLTHLLIYTMSRVYEHCTQLHQMSAYDLVRFQLNELAKESDEFKAKTTVAHYIKSRTYLSRSGIMKILYELRMGGYICVEKGVLKSITYLPKKY